MKNHPRRSSNPMLVLCSVTLALLAGGCDRRSASSEAAVCGVEPREFVVAVSGEGLSFGSLEGEPKQLTDDSDWKPSWSPNGTSLVFARTERGQILADRYDLFVLSVDRSGDGSGDAVPWPGKPLPGWSEELIESSWSTMGEIAYSTANGTYVGTADGLRIERVFDRGLESISWSDDGTRLLGRDGSRTLIVPVHSGGKPLGVGNRGDTAPAWHGEAITVRRPMSDSPPFRSRLVDLVGPDYRTSVPVLPKENTDGFEDYPNWSSDGRCLLFVRGKSLMVYDAVERRTTQVDSDRAFLSPSWRPAQK